MLPEIVPQLGWFKDLDVVPEAEQHQRCGARPQPHPYAVSTLIVQGLDAQTP